MTDDSFIMFLRNAFTAEMEGLPHPAQSLLRHLCMHADYKTHIHDARSLYELSRDWGYSDSVTRRNFKILEDRGKVKQLPGREGILVLIWEQVVRPPSSRENPTSSRELDRPQRGISQLQRGARPAKTTPKNRSERKEAEVVADRSVNLEGIKHIRESLPHLSGNHQG
jgi:DNA-binding transcriptional MocR family regulator